MAGVAGRSGGRNARTRQELEVAGTFRPDRHADLENPQPPSGTPQPPKVLKGEAAAEWGRMIERLDASKMLSTVDGGALYQYCRLFAETEAHAAAETKAAATIRRLKRKSPDYGERVAQLMQIGLRYATQVRQGRMALRTYLVEFGLTPAARSRVKVTGHTKDEQPVSPLAQLQQQASAIRRIK